MPIPAFKMALSKQPKATISFLQTTQVKQVVEKLQTEKGLM